MIAMLGIVAIGRVSLLQTVKGWLSIIGFAAICSTFSYIVRRNVNNEIENLLIFILIIGLLNIFVLRMKFYEAIFATLLGVIVFIITETICLLVVSSITGIKLNNAYLNDMTRFYISIPERIVQIFLIVFALRRDMKIIDMETPNIGKKEYYIQIVVYILSIGTLIFLAILMGKIIFFDNANHQTSSANDLLLRINIYLSLFVTIVLTLAIRSTHAYYKNKNALSKNEFMQSLDYISNMVENKNYLEAKEALNSLKGHLQHTD